MLSKKVRPVPTFRPGDLVTITDKMEIGVSLFQEGSVINTAPWIVDLRSKHRRYYGSEPPLLFLVREEKTVGVESVVLYHFLWGKEKWYYLEVGYDNIPIDDVFIKVNP